MGGSGFESKSSQNTERGLHPSLPVQTQSNQVTNCHKQLCQPTKTVPPSGGTVSADKQKCSRTGSKPKFTGFLQLAIFGTQTQQLVETYPGPEHLEHLPKHGVVQNGDPRDNKDLGEWVTSKDFKDAYFHVPIYSQSRKYMHFHINGQSYQFKALPFGLSTAPMEFTVVAKEVKLMALQRGIRIHQYLDDWLVRATSHQTCLQHIQTLVALCRELGWLVNEEKSELDPKQVFNFVGYQFDLKEGKVRPTPEHWQTLTDKILSILSGPVCLIRQFMSLIGLLTATEKQVHLGRLHMRPIQWHLKTTGGYQNHWKGDTRSQVTPPSLKVVAGGKQCSSRSTITPTKTCSADIYRCIKRRVGRSQVTLKARHIPGRLNVIADKLSRLGQTIQTEWSLHPEVFKAICSRWHQPQVDLFATRFNNKLPQFVSPVPDPQAWAVDALSLSWENLDPYAFPPAAILGKVVEKLQDYPCNRIILIAPGWPNMPWFWDLVAMSSQTPLYLPNLPNLVSQPFNQTLHRNLSNLNLHAWLLEPQQSRSRGFSEAVAARIEAPERGSTRSVYEAKWTMFTKWCLSNQVNFRAPPLKAIADFLLHLFQDRKLQPSTIDGYRSAIADKLGNSTINVSKDENLTRLLDSFHRDRPKGRRGIPSWNLSLVLHQLTKAPFEPLKEASLKHLTFKTVFLLALGSGKRRSEIHAWLHKNIRHQSDWSKVSLYPSPSFLSKNQLAKEGPDSVAPVVGITWTGPQILGRTRSWSLSPSRKVLVKTSHLPLSPHGSNKL